MWPIRKKILDSKRQEESWHKKNGEKALRPRVKYPCAHCGVLANSANIQVDHIFPVIPIDKRQKHLGTEHFTWTEYIERLFCSQENLWLLCVDCHSLKTSLENCLRREWGNYLDGKHEHPPEVRRLGKDFAAYTIKDTGCVGKRPPEI